MAFSVEDVRDLIKLLAEHPEWRAELRPVILGDELLGVPALIERLATAQEHTEERLAELALRVDALATAQAHTDARIEVLVAVQARTDARIEELAAAQARTEARVEELAAAQARTEARVEELAAAQARTEARVEELAVAQARTEARLDQLSRAVEDLTHVVDGLRVEVGRVGDRLGHVDGRWLEQRFYDRAPSYFAHVLRRGRVVELPEIGADEALAEGRLSSDDLEQLASVDVIVRGIRRDDGGDEVLLPVEVSVQIREGDVTRARQRARILERLGYTAVPAVGGERIEPAARKAAEQSGVLVRLVPRK